MDCECCGAYTRYRDFCGHWLCDKCAQDDDDAVDRAQQRQIDRSNED